MEDTLPSLKKTLDTNGTSTPDHLSDQQDGGSLAAKNVSSRSVMPLEFFDNPRREGSIDDWI